MPKTTSQLAIKRQEQLVKEAAIRDALLRAKQQRRSAVPAPKGRHDVDTLSRYLALPLRGPNVLRDPYYFKIRSCSRARQIKSLVDYLYLRYPVPEVLYRASLNGEGQALVFGNYRAPGPDCVKWFHCVAQGRSLAESAVGKLSKAEAHWYLLAPSGYDWQTAMLFAKVRALGLDQDVADEFCSEFVDAWSSDKVGHRLADLVRFYGKFAQSSDADQGIPSFLRLALENPAFSLKGRTVSSVQKLAAEYWRTGYIGHVPRFQAFRAKIAYWEETDGAVGVRALQIVSNRLLGEESKSMRHCVYTYEWCCENINTQIVSMRWHPVKGGVLDRSLELDRLTIEVSEGEVVQVKGRFNRTPTREEMKVVARWARDRGIVPPKVR